MHQDLHVRYSQQFTNHGDAIRDKILHLLTLLPCQMSMKLQPL
jgi:hypothetical protein